MVFLYVPAVLVKFCKFDENDVFIVNTFSDHEAHFSNIFIPANNSSYLAQEHTHKPIYKFYEFQTFYTHYHLGQFTVHFRKPSLRIIIFYVSKWFSFYSLTFLAKSYKFDENV